MPIHLLKTAVGISDIAELRARQATRAGRWPVQERESGEDRDVVYGYTRRRPTRDGEVLDGGSIFWIIKGVINVRQRILGLEESVDGEGKAFCLMVFDPELIETVGRRKKPIQGWRYLEPSDAPADLVGPIADGDDTLPPDLARELRNMGVM
jgi:hypothetical protein